MTQSRDVAVLLGDPRLPYQYNPGNAFDAHDFQAVERLEEVLATLGNYQFRFLDDHDQLWESLRASKPVLVLNLCNTGFRNKPEHQAHVAAMLEMLEVPYVGAAPECMALCHHKFLVYALARDIGIPVPEGRLLDASESGITEIEFFPSFIKPNAGDGSIGISDASIVHNAREAREVIETLRAELNNPLLLLQEYLPGPEYSVAVVGNPGIELLALPPIEIDFSSLGNSHAPILTHESKNDPHSLYWRSVHLRQSDAGALNEQMMTHAKRLFERIGCRDYARFDFRVDRDGTPHLIDVNAHPMWGEEGMLASAMRYGGYEYAGLFEFILRAAQRRLGLADD